VVVRTPPRTRNPGNLTKRFAHPDLEALSFCYTNRWLSQRLGGGWVSYTPRDPDIEAQLDRFDEAPVFGEYARHGNDG
jgi:hypothetical protein